ncbi:connector enhancer of kinase suppressor of ras 1 isoform X2 [Microtus oregoni]|uniref:connector enhancer of kinase suppressor of ras 1 isoform X2 n=1 Tax=Microtus oregoni TaxID=111838 RepID=UPI001BB0F2E9|nr:connector enhancer of kinase suppressor of ras 1 isoform X2 [Microtus oregoni]
MAVQRLTWVATWVQVCGGPALAQPGRLRTPSWSGNSCRGWTPRAELSMEPVDAWTPGKVAAWLRGLDDALQDYPFEDWQLPGKYLLQLCPQSLEALTVWPLGHQELILDGVEQLRALGSKLPTENLQSLAQGLLERTQAFQSLVQGRLGNYPETPSDVLTAAVELVREAQALLSWLNRYLFSQLNDFSACQDIGVLCRELGQVLQEDCPEAEKESSILRICSHVAGICHNILSCSPEELLEQRAVLEQVQLDDPSDLEIHTTSNCLHFVSQVGAQAPASSQILPGDEIVQINEQVVVGWSHKNVMELLREPGRVSLVLKKIPVPETPSQTPLDSPHLPSQSLPLTPLSPRVPSEGLFAFNLSADGSPGTSAAWTDSASLDTESLPTPPPAPGTVSEITAESPETSGHSDQSSTLGRKKSKGMATRLSRRRVSCRELGLPDCDGWLLLRKVPGGFMGPRWRRCWFVLKGHNLYWYRQPQDEKAEGLINVSNYSLESGQDQKKKYVFLLTHDVYKPFVFAAETLSDLSMWVRHLITCISKYQTPGQAASAREEDCYSETEAEDPDEEAGSRSASPSLAPAWSDPSPTVSPSQSPRTSIGSSADSSDRVLEGMVQGLRQGGVSLLGQPQPLTHEQWRSSFMRRNRDPHLNERAHRVRALQSTLKAKLQELRALEEVLDDPELTGAKFRQWKERNQELYSEGLSTWGGIRAQNSSSAPTSDSRGQSPQPLPAASDPEESSQLFPLTSENSLQPPDL